jgi:anti-sigma regulatory factor (Ser/Thr protein kinase)
VNGDKQHIEPFAASLPPEAGALLGFRQSLRGWLQTAELESRAENALVLAAHEAVANGVEHGSGSPIRVDGRPEDGGLVIEITTEGSWEPESNDDGVLAEGGRGLALMRGLVDLELQIDDGCVRIRLRPSDG